MLLASLTTGCVFGFTRGDFWEGKSTGDLGACVPFDFHVVVEDGRIGGYAVTDFEWGTTQWELRGLVGPERRVTLETRTQDPRVPQPSLTWTGRYNPRCSGRSPTARTQTARRRGRRSSSGGGAAGPTAGLHLADLVHAE